MLVIEKEWFHGERSYNAFLLAVDLTLKLEALRLKGAMIFDEGDVCNTEGKWRVRLEGDQSNVGYTFDKCTQLYAGCTHDAETGKIWLTKKMVNEAFADVKVVMPKDIISLKDLK
jgi:hypothetical protein